MHHADSARIKTFPMTRDDTLKENDVTFRIKAGLTFWSPFLLDEYLR